MKYAVRSHGILVAVAIAAAPFLSACAPAGEANHPAEREPAAFVELPGGGIVSADAPVVTNTEEMVPWSDIVATGVIMSFSDGEVRHDTGGSTHPVIAHVARVEVHEGSLPEGSDRTLYIALVAPAGAEAVAESIPIGTTVLVYGVVQNAPDEPDHTTVVEGMPSDQLLYGVVHPAGLIFELGAQNNETALAWPMYGGAVEGASIEDALPGAPIPYGIDRSALHNGGSPRT